MFQPIGFMYEVDTYDIIDDTCFRVPIGNLVFLLDSYIYHKKPLDTYIGRFLPVPWILGGLAKDQGITQPKPPEPKPLAKSSQNAQKIGFSCS